MLVYCTENGMIVYQTDDNFNFIISTVVYGCKNTFPKIETKVPFVHNDTGFLIY